MNSSEIRKENIKFLIDTRFDGNKAAFAKAIGKQDSQIYRIFNKSGNGRNIGDETAREIEVKLGLNKDILDQPIFKNVSTMKIELDNATKDLTDEQYKALILMASAFKSK